MTDFDNLIKEKAEKAEYKYTASAWKRFASRAGFKVGLSGLQIAVVTIASVAVVGGAIFFTAHSKNVSSPVAQQPATHIVVAVDSVATETEAAAEIITQHAEKKIDTKTNALPASVENETVEITAPPENKVSTHAPVKTKVRYGRIARINVDTITDNVPTDEELRKGNSRL